MVVNRAVPAQCRVGSHDDVIANDAIVRDMDVGHDLVVVADAGDAAAQGTHMRMYRTPEWKLIRDFLNEGRDELYHLTEDPDETTNLIASEDPAVAGIIEQLHGKIIEYMRETNDPVLEQAEARSTD